MSQHRIEDGGSSPAEIIDRITNPGASAAEIMTALKQQDDTP